MYPIGTKFTPRGKNNREHTIIDTLRTYDSNNRLVRFRYVATKQIMGQTVTDYNVVHTTIELALAYEKNKGR